MRNTIHIPDEFDELWGADAGARLCASRSEEAALLLFKAWLYEYEPEGCKLSGEDEEAWRVYNAFVQYRERQ